MRILLDPFTLLMFWKRKRRKRSRTRTYLVSIRKTEKGGIIWRKKIFVLQREIRLEIGEGEKSFGEGKCHNVRTDTETL